jgi:hypothetical protein
MFALSCLWHGVALTDLDELRMPLGLYFGLAGVAYLLIALGISIAVRQGVLRQWISLKRGFPLTSTMVGVAIGAIVYLLVFTLGLSFAGHELRHVILDALWQMFEQGIGGLVVSAGMIYIMHRSFIEGERAH